MLRPDQIGLVAADNRTRANHRFKFRAIGASSSGLRNSFATKTVGEWNQLPAVVVEQESPAAFKNQLDRLAPVAYVACRNAPPPPICVILHEEVYQLFIKTRQDIENSVDILRTAAEHPAMSPKRKLNLTSYDTA